MFSPARMMRLTVIALERDKRTLLKVLGRLGVVELRATPVDSNTPLLASRDCKEELSRCANLLARVGELRRSLEIPPQTLPFAEPVEVSLEEADRKVHMLDKRVQELVRNRQAVLQRSRELGSSAEQLANYCGLDIPLDRLEQSPFLHFVIGSMPGENLTTAQERLGSNIVLLPMRGPGERQCLVAIGSSKAANALEQALTGFHPERIPSSEGKTVDELADMNRREQENAAKELERLSAELRALAEEAKEPLEHIEQQANLEKQLLLAEQKFGCTESVFILTGWTPAADVARLEHQVREVAKGRCVIELAVPTDVPEEEIPVLLQRSSLLRPFQRLVTAYGLPKYQELEPTLFMAFTWLVMFGMMFGDAGQGLALVCCGVVAWVRGRKTITRDVGILLACAGTSSVIFGIIYGSYFGIPQLKRHALWHDPLEGDSAQLLTFAIGLGVVMISLGLVLNIVNRFRHHDVSGGLLGQFGFIGVLFYWGALALITKYAAIRASGIMGIAIILVVVLPLVGWIAKGVIDCYSGRRAGRSGAAGGLSLAVMESLVVSFESVLLYFANTVSFVRLAAYAMSHAALLVATFTVAEDVSHVSNVGTALGLIVIILGNVVAIVLEGIIAAVQGLRLEYYEFFGKFFSGEGQPFTPFQLFAPRES